MDIQTKKKTEKDSGLQKDSGQGEKRKGEKAKEGKESEKEIQRRWMQSPLSTTDGLEKGGKREKYKEKRDTEALDAVATKHHRRFRKRKGIGLDTHAQKSV